MKLWKYKKIVIGGLENQQTERWRIIGTEKRKYAETKEELFKNDEYGDQYSDKVTKELVEGTKERV